MFSKRVLNKTSIRRQDKYKLILLHLTFRYCVTGQVKLLFTSSYFFPKQVLEDKYGGWQNVSMVGYFNDFANLCFERFGNRVKHWITFSNPWVSHLNISFEIFITSANSHNFKQFSAIFNFLMYKASTVIHFERKCY